MWGEWFTPPQAMHPRLKLTQVSQLLAVTKHTKKTFQTILEVVPKSSLKGCTLHFVFYSALFIQLYYYLYGHLLFVTCCPLPEQIIIVRYLFMSKSWCTNCTHCPNPNLLFCRLLNQLNPFPISLQVSYQWLPNVISFETQLMTHLVYDKCTPRSILKQWCHCLCCH